MRLHQKSFFLGSGLAAENDIALRKAAEVINDGLVAQFVLQVGVHAGLAKQAFGDGVKSARFAVHVRYMNARRVVGNV